MGRLSDLPRVLVVGLANATFIRWIATHRAGGWRVASRFVAGETLDDAMRVAEELDGSGIAAMLDLLGENETTEADAVAAADDYLAAIERIRRTPDLDCAISIKLTALGLELSPAVCLAQVERILSAAEPAGTWVMIDMEGSAYTDRTLELFRDVRTRHDLIGVCLQSALRRTAGDVLSLPDASVVRLVKGAYLEPEEIAFRSRREVDASWARVFTTLVSRAHTVHAATHDPRLIDGATRVVEERRIPWSHVELQMLYGIRRDLQDRLALRGYPLRVYVPYGTEWYPYLTRRLAERPANVWFFLSNLVRRRT